MNKKKKTILIVSAVAAAVLIAVMIVLAATGVFGKKKEDTGRVEPPHTHTLVRHAGTATCEEAGEIEYWSCSGCGKTFSDGEGKTEVTDLSAPALGHTEGEWTDGGEEHFKQCTRCQKELKREPHTLEGNRCTLFGHVEEEKDARLLFVLSEDSSHYIVAGIEEGSTGTRVIVPEEHLGVPVTEIADSAFDSCEISELSLPETITKIGESAFGLVTGLKEAVVPLSVESMGAYAFWGSSLERVTVGKALAKGAFQQCENLAEVIVAEGVTTLTLALSEGESYKTYVFYKSPVKTVRLPSTLVKFSGGMWPMESFFSYCTELETLEVAAGNENFCAKENVLCNGAGTEALYVPEGLKTVKIAEGITALPSGCFEGYENVETVELPSSLTKLPQYCFSESSIVSVSLPDSITSLGDWCFYSCKKLETLHIGSGLGSGSIWSGIGISTRTFRGTHVAKELTVSTDNQKFKAEGGALLSKDGKKIYLTNAKLEIPDGVEELDCYLFSDDETLQTFTFPEGIKGIGYGTFTGCANLKTVKLPSTLEYIDAYAFSETGIEEITIPKSVTKIGMEAFRGCEELREVVFENEVGWYTFQNGSSSIETRVDRDVSDPAANAEALLTPNLHWARDKSKD